MAGARAAHRPAEARRRDGRALRSSFLNELEFPLADRSSRSSASCSASRRRSRRCIVPDIDAVARRATRQDDAFGTRSRRWAPGGPSFPVLALRARAFVALAAAVRVYYGTHQWWFSLSLWWAIAWLCFVLIPAVFGLVYLALPLWRSPTLWLFCAALGFIALAIVLQAAGRGPVANFAKLAAMTSIGWCFLHFFEEASWVVLVAVIVPWVDSYSVWRGPTKTIVTRSPRCSRRSRSRSPFPARTEAQCSACPTCSSSRSSSARAPVSPAAVLDLALPHRLARRDHGARDRVGRERPAGAAAALPRVPAAERGSALAGGSPEAQPLALSRQRSPSSSERPRLRRPRRRRRSGSSRPRSSASPSSRPCRGPETVPASMFGTQSSPPIAALASGFAPTVTVAVTARSPGRRDRPCPSRSRPRASRPSA